MSIEFLLLFPQFWLCLQWYFILSGYFIFFCSPLSSLSQQKQNAEKNTVAAVSKPSRWRENYSVAEENDDDDDDWTNYNEDKLKIEKNQTIKEPENLCGIVLTAAAAASREEVQGAVWKWFAPLLSMIGMVN